MALIDNINYLPKHHPKYGGTLTFIEKLPIGTNFYTMNGHWNGEIVKHENEKKLHVKETDEYHKINPTKYLWIEILN